MCYRIQLKSTKKSWNMCDRHLPADRGICFLQMRVHTGRWNPPQSNRCPKVQHHVEITQQVAASAAWRTITAGSLFTLGEVRRRHPAIHRKLSVLFWCSCRLQTVAAGSAYDVMHPLPKGQGPSFITKSHKRHCNARRAPHYRLSVIL